MDADDDLSPPDAELDEYGVPVQPLPEWPIRDFLVAVCCLACASVPPLMLFGYIGKYSHLRLGLRLEAMAGGLVVILPWFVLKRYTLRRFGPHEILHGAWRLIAVAVALCSVAAVILFFSGLFGSVCHRNCGGY